MSGGGGWSGISRCPTTSGYFRLPQYKARDYFVRSPSWPQSRMTNIRQYTAVSRSQRPVFSISTACCCPPPSAQFCGSPAPPYPLMSPTAGSVFDVRSGAGGPHPHSGWAVRRFHRRLSSTMEELSPSAEPPTTTTPAVRRQPYGVDEYFDLDHQNRCYSAVRCDLRRCSDEGQSSVESSSDRLATGVPWSTTAVRSDQQAGPRSNVTSQRCRPTAQWHIGDVSHTRRDTF